MPTLLSIIFIQSIFRLKQDYVPQSAYIDYANAEINYRTQPKQQPDVPLQQDGVSEKKKTSEQTRAKSIKLIRNDHTPTTAASSNKRDDLQSADLIDIQSGKPIQPRKKVAGRIDQFLESRGSIFSGRDEAQVLQMKRQQEQREIQEALKQQIEDKKMRQQQEKIKQDQFDDQWQQQTPKGSRIRLESQGESTFTGLMSPGTVSQFSLYNQVPQSSHSQFASMNQQKYINNRKSDLYLDVLEEEKSSDVTGAFIVSPSILNSGQKTPHEPPQLAQIELKRHLKLSQQQSELPKSNSQKVLGLTPHGSARNQNVRQLVKQIQQKNNPQVQEDVPMTAVQTQDTVNTASQSVKVVPQLQQAKIESQSQIDALSTMVEQLLHEQKQLKTKIFQQEKILEDHLQTKEPDNLSTDRGSQRASSREFKIRKSKVGQLSVQLQKQPSEERVEIKTSTGNDGDEEMIQKNVILNHQITLKNQNAQFKQAEQSSNQRYNNRQSNKMQFIERNEKLKQQNHLIKYAPTKSNNRQGKEQSQEPQREVEMQNMAQNPQNFTDFANASNNHEKLAVAKSIDALHRNGQYNNQMRVLQRDATMKHNSQSQENMKFSQSVKNLNIQSQMHDPKMTLTQNLDFKGQSQLLYFSENQQKSTGANFLPEIKKNMPNTQGMTRTSSESVLSKIEGGNFRDNNTVNSNYQHYENNQKKSKQKSRQEELDMISSIFMPDSVVINSYEQNTKQPTLQNNLISSQKFLSNNESATQQNMQTFYSNAQQNMLQQHLEQIDEYVPKTTLGQNQQQKAKIIRKKSFNKLSIFNSNNNQPVNSNLRLSQRKFFKNNPSPANQQQQPEINLADRITFSNFYKDNGQNNFEPIQFEQQQYPQQNSKRQSPSPQNFTSSRQSNGFNPPIMVIKKNQNLKLAPIQLKKITPVKKKFPHDFFSGNHLNHDTGDE